MQNETLELLIDEIEGEANKKVFTTDFKEKTIHETYNLLNFETINFEILNDNEDIIKVSAPGYILLDALVKALKNQALHNAKKDIIKNILSKKEL